MRDQMAKQLVIAEKPSVARDIANVLQCSNKGDGYIEGSNYVITWAIGHLVTLCEPEDYGDQYKKWQFKLLPIMPSEMKLKPYEKTVKQLKIIDKLLKRNDIDSIICATDSGREGELIFRYIYQYTGCDKPFKRLWISSMTDQAILAGFEGLKDGSHYDHLFASARCRSEADWLVGINATRAYTTQNNVLLSVGRVQTPTLALIVDRQKEINCFVPRDYFEVQVDYGDFKGTWFDEKPSETKIDQEDKAKAIIEKVQGKDGVVKSISKKKNKQPPPNLYDLTELQRDGNKQFGYTAQQVLNIAQDLYEKRKMITYPRTDSRFLSDDMKSVVKKTLEKISVPPYQKAIALIFSKGELKFTKRIIDNSKVTDHHAIIPAEVVPKIEYLTKEEKNIYNLIVKRFIAVFYDDFLFETTELVVISEKESFVSKGKIITQKGWKSLYTNDKDDDLQTLPELKKGDGLTIQTAELLKKQTSPPKPFTEATLLSAMENAGRFVEDDELKEMLKESGFGTPATRAGIIERLIQVEYIIRKGKVLQPTPKGSKLIEIVPSELKSPETTGKWEKALNKISKGELDTERFIKSIQRFTSYIVEASSQTKHVVFEKETRPNEEEKRIPSQHFGICPLCKEGYVLENTKSYYCSCWKEKCGFTLWKSNLDQLGLKLSEEEFLQLIRNQEVKNITIIAKESENSQQKTVKMTAKGEISLID